MLPAGVHWLFIAPGVAGGDGIFDCYPCGRAGGNLYDFYAYYLGPGPDCEPCAAQLHGDANCDGLVNNFDIDCFVSALTAGEAEWNMQCDPAGNCIFLCVNDINLDGAVNNFDIDSFVECLTTGCP